MGLFEQRYPMNAFRICINKRENGLEGHVYTPLKAGGFVFSGLAETIVEMDVIFDEHGYPQSYQNKRAFDDASGETNRYKGKPDSNAEAVMVAEYKGEFITLDILVRSRMNTSWQGFIYGEGDIKESFNGDVELLEKLNALIME